MKTIKSFLAERRRKKERKAKISELNMRLEILWDDLDLVVAESNTATIIRRRISDLTAELAALRSLPS